MLSQSLYRVRVVCLHWLWYTQVPCLCLQMLEETLSPMWNELLLFDQLIIDGKREELKTETPIIIINLFSHNKFVSVAVLPSCYCFQGMEGRGALCGCCSRHVGAAALCGFHDSAWSWSTDGGES